MVAMAQGATSWQTADESRLVIDASLDAVRVEVGSETLTPDVRAVCLELHQDEIADKGSVFLSPEEATRLADALLRAASNHSSV
jgi:hypothetical protein